MHGLSSVLVWADVVRGRLEGMSKPVDIILKVVLPQMAAHVPGLYGLALRHLAMTTEDQGLFKGVVAVPTREKKREKEPVDGWCQSDEVFV
jgi:hypothetical protein